MQVLQKQIGAGHPRSDFDNDGYRDIIITNGYPKDVTDHDFVAFRRTIFYYCKQEVYVERNTQVKIPNYVFQNNGNLNFQKCYRQMGLTIPSFSNGQPMPILIMMVIWICHQQY